MDEMQINRPVGWDSRSAVTEVTFSVPARYIMHENPCIRVTTMRILRLLRPGGKHIAQRMSGRTMGR